MKRKMHRTIEVSTAIDDLESILKSSCITRFKQDKFKVFIPPPMYGYRLSTAKVICGKIEHNNVITIYVRPTLFELLIGIVFALILIYCFINVLLSHVSICFFVCYVAFVVFYVSQTLWHMKECLDSYCQWIRLTINGNIK